jgi:7-carboxy-7-deazaguanine synthase
MRILEVFDSIQGEGVWTGTPMTFVRLAGCNGPEKALGCVRWCDTPTSWDPAAGRECSAAEVASRVGLPRACITGGEPLLQAEDVAALIGLLHERGVRAHLETNGTLPLAFGEAPDWVTAGPKPPAYQIHPALGPAVDEIKLVADAAFAPEVAESLARLHPRAQVCIQPEASEGDDAVRVALAAVMSHPRWRLSLQTHKLLGIR